MNKNFSIGECFSVGWAQFKTHAWFLIGMTFGFYLIMAVFAGLIDSVYRDIEPSRSLLDIFSNLFIYWIYFGITAVSLKIIDQRPYIWSDLFVFDKQVIFYWIGAFLYAIVVVLGFVALIIPGIYLAVRYGFFWYAIVDGRKGIVEAFKESARITDGVKWKLILFGLTSIGVIILGVLCFGIGMLVAIPVVMLATAHLYRVLLAQSVVTPESETVPATPSRPAGEAPTAAPVAVSTPTTTESQAPTPQA